MSLDIQSYERVPFNVEAVRITLDNFDDVAKWCGGEKKLEKRGPDRSGTRNLTQFIEVPVNNPLTEKQKLAFVGNWVLKAGTGFKVYTDKAFQACFRKVLPRPTVEEIWTDDMLPIKQQVAAQQASMDHQIVTGRPSEPANRNDIETHEE
jgi:hypothetical protein